MKIIEQSWSWIQKPVMPLETIELAGRTCYKSENKITEDSASKFVRMLRDRKHHAMLEFGNAIVKFITNRGVCYDDKTEVLTKKGWKLFQDISKNDEYLTFNIDNKEHEYQKAINKTIEDWNGKLIGGKSSMVDFLVTPNHRMVYFNYDCRINKKYQIKPAHEIFNKRVKFKRGLFKKWNGEKINIDYPQVSTLEFAKFLGIFITDGSLDKNEDSGGKIRISQTKTSGCEFIERTLNQLNWKFKYNGNDYIIYDTKLYNFLINLFPEKPRKQNCRVPEWVKNAPLNYIKYFMNGVITGDGSTHKGNNHIVIYGSNKLLLDDFQECVLKMGLCSSVRTDDRVGMTRILNGNTITNKKIGYILSITQRTNDHLFNKENWYVKHYKGKVYCVTVPNGTLYVRRNGKAFWSGNTHELVRHRLCSFAQESTRYCNYGGKDIEFIKPVWFKEKISANSVLVWKDSMQTAEKYYNHLLLVENWRPEQAREVLPNSLKTEICVSANLREWRHIFQLRISPQAHPQIRELMISCLNGFKQEIPVLFDDINNG